MCSGIPPSLLLLFPIIISATQQQQGPPLSTKFWVCQTQGKIFVQRLIHLWMYLICVSQGNLAAYNLGQKESWMMLLTASSHHSSLRSAVKSCSRGIWLGTQVADVVALVELCAASLVFSYLGSLMYRYCTLSILVFSVLLTAHSAHRPGCVCQHLVNMVKLHDLYKQLCGIPLQVWDSHGFLLLIPSRLKSAVSFLYLGYVLIEFLSKFLKQVF